MGFRSRFIAGLGWRAAMLLGTLFLFLSAIDVEGLGVARLLSAGLCLWALFELWRYIQRTNIELARFLEAVRLGDLSQSFAHRADGSGFTDIGEALDEVIEAALGQRRFGGRGDYVADAFGVGGGRAVYRGAGRRAADRVADALARAAR